MTKISKSISTLLVLGGIALSGVPTAFAADNGFYLGGAVGRSDFRDACSDLTGFVGTCDDKDTAWKIFGGYQINKYFGAELGYVDFGKATATGTFGGVPASADIKVKAWEILGVGTFPITGGLSAYGKAGFARWDIDSSATFGGAAGSFSDNGTDFTFGLGVKYDFTPNLAARAEFQRYNNVGNSTTGESDINLWTIGVMYKF